MIINSNKEDKRYVGTNLMMLVFTFITVSFIYPEFLSISVVVIILAFKIFVYQIIELFFDKVIVKKSNSLFVKFVGISFPVSIENSYLVIEDTINLSTNGIKYPTLNIHRNENSFLNRLFKNKIKLHFVKNSDSEKIKTEAKLISETFGIRFIDDYDFS